MNTPLLTSNFPSPEKIRQDIESTGFAVYHDCIPSELMHSMKQFWSQHFKNNPHPKRQSLRGNLRLGDENFISYSDDSTWTIFRDFDFLWNAPNHELTRNICIAIHEQRNLAQGFAKNYGLSFNQEKYGVYISTSFYPENNGFLIKHSDGHKNTPILQFMLNLTHFGTDYEDGGLYIYDKQNKRIEVEPMLKSGSVVFFDGRLEHGVDPVSNMKSNSIKGRIATFAIPTHFVSQGEIPAPIRKLEQVYFRSESLIQTIRKKLNL